VSTTEELLGRKSSGSGLESQEYGRRDSSRWPRGTSYPKKELALTSLTSGGRYSSPADSGHWGFFMVFFVGGVALVESKGFWRWCTSTTLRIAAFEDSVHLPEFQQTTKHNVSLESVYVFRWGKVTHLFCCVL
jgi:hypothetical protein